MALTENKVLERAFGLKIEKIDNNPINF